MTRALRFAGVGILIAIAVAWTDAFVVDLWSDRRQRPGISGEERPCWAVTTKRRFGAAYVFRMPISDPATTVPARELPLSPTGDDVRSQWVRRHHADMLAVPTALDAATMSFRAKGWGAPVAVPYWSRAAVAPPSDQTCDTFVGAVEDARGWPFICLVSETEATMYFSVAHDKAGVVTWHPSGWLHGDSTWGVPVGLVQGADHMPRLLPLRPVWLGLLLDGAFYAACGWVILALRRRLVRGWRERRGRCGTCGYVLGASVRCSECGTDTGRASARVE